jgi:cytochrome d ubiquinol oxidase subunit I
MDTLILSRIQFGANISFNILFRLRFSATGEQKWMDAYMFWVKVFALSFAMGVVSGITMSFQFGTNWPGFMEKVGNVAGPLLAYEVLTAFFLEAGFLGIMLFGAARVPGWLHTLATVLVAFGTTLSAFWIIVLNSWMHTPAGYELREGVVHATDWAAIVFNPSMPYRLAHMLLASGLTVAFLIAGVSAFRRLIGDRSETVATTLRFGLVLAALLIPMQILVGDHHGLNTLEHQPAKIAAMEGNWETGPDKPLLLFAIPDEAARENRFEIGIPHGASLILTHKWDGIVPGLDDYVLADGTVMHPPVAPVFWSFRVMVGMGVLMLAASWAGVWLSRRRRSGVDGLPKALLAGLVAMTFAGWIATLAGWYTTEIGRQPWLVTGVLTTKEAVSDVAAGMVLGTLLTYLAVYVVLLAAYIATIFGLAGKASKGQALPPEPRLGSRPGLQPAE